MLEAYDGNQVYPLLAHALSKLLNVRTAHMLYYLSFVYCIINKDAMMGNRRAKDIIKILKENGFEEVGQKGSHKKLKHGNIIVIIPEHGGKDLGTGLIRKIEKQTGVKLLN